MRWLYGTFIIQFAIGYLGAQQIPCTQKLALEGEDSFVCVCNSSGCDSIGQIPLPSPGTYLHVASSKDELRFHQVTAPKSFAVGEAKTTIFVNDTDVRQRIYGFGGAFTDATGLNIRTISQGRQQELMRGYFSPEGLEYNIGRIPMAGTDFSTRPYSYDDVDGDADLAYFNLTMEDYEYKLPYIKQAMAMNDRSMLFFGSPWAPPSWMKTNGMFNGSGGLLPQYDQAWANYFVKFLEAYKAEGVNLWGLTAQNEPSLGYTDYKWNACGFTAEEQRDYVRDYLGPTLKASKFSNVTLMISDDSRQVYPRYPTTVLEDEDAAKFVEGVAVHWYSDNVPVEVVSTVHNRFPDKFILYTEACSGYRTHPDVQAVRLGNWERGQRYALDIIENLNHWSTGWVDWNMALDMMGGPNWALNYVDSPVIINKEKDEFYKQPMYYAMGHFSKFIPEGYISVSSNVEEEATLTEQIQATAVTDPTMQYVVLVVVNTKENDELVAVTDNFGKFEVLLPGNSINTITYSKLS